MVFTLRACCAAMLKDMPDGRDGNPQNRSRGKNEEAVQNSHSRSITKGDEANLERGC